MGASKASSGPSRPYHAFAFGALYVFSLILVAINFPSLEPSQKAQLVVPRSLDDAKLLRNIFSQYTSTHHWSVVSAFVLVFLTLQTFCIPGTVFLSFLSGALFGFKVGFPLTILCSTLGASSCYLLSSLVGGGLVTRSIASIFPDRIARFQAEINKHKSHVFNYLLFLRISPLLPNWFVNLTSPILGVPFPQFALATAIGVMPATFLCVRAGLTLQTMQSTSDAIDLRSLAILFLLAFLPIIPTLKPVQSRLRKILKTE